MDSIKYLYLNTRDEFFRVDISKIVYFESEGNYTNFVMANGHKGQVCMNLAKMQELLTASLKQNASIFARVGKRHIINLHFIFQIAILRQRLVLSDCQSFSYSLNISKEALKSLRNIYIGK
ncbi:MAG: LytTR family transcriptional regulator DNA-binding domain-containing protein [Clostridium sp.]|nr:LytTR family transcriptional regulator DNA-binding domain-containing protein [Prevotella sp.]MCM1428669.1 LytTR family transcriptional regulator DNA-binding domain-containing protein [Clostridium sp.]